MTPEQRASRREALKRMRAKRRATGLCIQCGFDSSGRVRCFYCRLAIALTRQDKLEAAA